MNRVYQLSNVSNIHNKGIYGQGITVAILDSGTSPHPDFIYPENRIIGWYDVINGKPQPYDDNGHGTHVAGIIASNGMASQGKIMGMAPKVKIVSVKVLDHKGDGNSKDVIEGLQWVLQNKERYNIRIVNISVGTPIGKEQGENSELVQMVNRIWDAGIIVVAAAGNNGPEPGSVGAPGNSRKVITVGAIEEPGGIMRHGEMVRDYSGRGPTRECIKKPDVVSWGNQILSCRNFTGMRGRFSERTISNSSLNRYYTRKNGTSMATPIVSGGIALLLSCYPQMSNLEVKIRLKNSAVDMGFPHEKQGWGRFDVEGMFMPVNTIQNFKIYPK